MLLRLVKWDLSSHLDYPELQRLRCLDLEFKSACDPKLCRAAAGFAQRRVVQPLLEAVLKPGRCTITDLIRYYTKERPACSYILKAKNFSIPAEEAFPRVPGMTHSAELCVVGLQSEDSAHSVAERLLRMFQEQCLAWRENPETVIRGSFIGPEHMPPRTLERPGWRDWASFTSQFPWKDATAEETQGPAFRAYCLRSNRHIYEEIDGKWFSRSNETLKKPIVVPAGLYFDSELLLTARYFSTMKSYADHKALTVKLRFLCDDLVLQAAIQELRA
ncbi:unnamed protein product [Effrenium voratum]|nr:unnamed protein product [Effrenium voratum]